MKDFKIKGFRVYDAEDEDLMKLSINFETFEEALNYQKTWNNMKTIILAECTSTLKL